MKTSPYTQTEMIDPQTAQSYLTRNIGNRKINDKVVGLYTRLMRDGKWILSNYSIVFSDTNILLNGQHRLTAVIKSGVTCPFSVQRGVPEMNKKYMDNGHLRTAANALELDGVLNAVRIASIIRSLYNLRKKTILAVTGQTRYSNGDISDEYFAHSDFYNKVQDEAHRLYPKGRVLNISEYGSLIAYLSADLHHDFDKVVSFFREVAGVNTPTNNVTTMLRIAILTDKMSRYRMTRERRMKLIIKAWNTWLIGKQVKQLSWNSVQEKDIWFI